MSEALKKIRQRNAEEEAMLRGVRKYQGLVRNRTATVNLFRSWERTGLATSEEVEIAISAHAEPKRKEADKLIAKLAKEVRPLPVWAKWMKHVRGLGDTLAVQLIAHIQPIRDFENVAKLWAYAGYKVVDGEAERRQRGKQSRWNPDLKLVCYQLGDCFVKAGGPYRELYDRYKARDRAVHPEPVPKVDTKGQPVKDRDGKAWKLYTPGHMHKRAMRYAVKLFLSHLWQVWRELEGLPVRAPYPIEVLGHGTIISPWSMIESHSPCETPTLSASHSAGETHAPSASQYRNETQGQGAPCQTVNRKR